MGAKVICDFCGEGLLSWLESNDGGEGGYLCEYWSKCPPGMECAKLVSEEDYNLLLEESIERRRLDELRNETTPEECKEANVAALKSGDLFVKRQPLMPKLLRVSDEDSVIKRPFKSPLPGAPSSSSKELVRRLQGYRKFVPWGSLHPTTNYLTQSSTISEIQKEEIVLPPGIEPLVLWQPEDDKARASEKSKPIIVDPFLTRFLRPHQREGVQFMFECVAGLRDFSEANQEGDVCCGCILADDMGLGKTLQSITLLWTLLEQGFHGSAMVRRAVVVTPTSLVSNWEAEIKKWLEDRVKVIGLCESTRANVMLGITNFLAPRSIFRVLIISYETFRIHAKRLQQKGGCDLLICDEAHRLKNDKTLTNQALAGLSCRRRVLLSGTPMQNDLEEFYAMVNFTNPGILGDATAFRRYYENPILIGREPDASDSDRELGAERSNELSDKVNHFILRRTNALLSNHLPPKIVEVVCCRLSDLQQKLYCQFIQSKKVKRALEDNSKRSQVLASITALKKLCNHPKLIYDTIRAGGAEAAGFEDCLELFPPAVLSERSGAWSGGDGLWVELSGKMSVLARLLGLLRETTDDRIVLVSNYTQTLDLFAQLCRERGYPFIRLDGSTSIGKRQKLVQQFNDPLQDQFAFLLSSKAGGCGLNLIGGNRLVLFDPDWNPANDKQAAARVWRDGQKKRVFIYRFLSTGTIEEKVYQRQMSKEGLQKVVDNDKSADSKAQVNLLSSEDLRDLFTLRDTTSSDTHDTLSCQRCPSVEDVSESGHPVSDALTVSGISHAEPTISEDVGKFAEVAGVYQKLKPWQRQIGNPLEEQLQMWGHHSDIAILPDIIMQKAGIDNVSFIFSCQIDGKLVPQDRNPATQHSHHGSRFGNGLGKLPRLHRQLVLPQNGPSKPTSAPAIVVGPISAPKSVPIHSNGAKTRSGASTVPKSVEKMPIPKEKSVVSEVADIQTVPPTAKRKRSSVATKRGNKGAQESPKVDPPTVGMSLKDVKKSLRKSPDEVVFGKDIIAINDFEGPKMDSRVVHSAPLGGKQKEAPINDKFTSAWEEGLLALDSSDEEKPSEDSDDSLYIGGDDDGDD